MAKYRILLTGKNNSIIDDFFNRYLDDYTLLTTSSHFHDMENHIDIFKPDIFIYCPSNESRDEISKLVELKRKITRYGIIFAIIGSKEECTSFIKRAPYMVNLTLEKPISIDTIHQKINDYMSARAEEREDAKKELARLEALRNSRRRKHVLIIDDDPQMLKLIKEHLHENYDVATAINGKIAYKFLEQKTTDLILLDYKMPEENGVAVLSHLRANPRTADIPVLFLTGVSDRNMITEALKHHPQGYLLKPIDRENLLGTIEKFIG